MADESAESPTITKPPEKEEDAGESVVPEVADHDASEQSVPHTDMINDEKKGEASRQEADEAVKAISPDRSPAVQKSPSNSSETSAARAAVAEVASSPNRIDGDHEDTGAGEAMGTDASAARVSTSAAPGVGVEMPASPGLQQLSGRKDDNQQHFPQEQAAATAGAEQPQPQQQPIQLSTRDRLLNAYIYDYLLKNDLHNSARSFLSEADVPIHPAENDTRPHQPQQRTDGLDERGPVVKVEEEDDHPATATTANGIGEHQALEETGEANNQSSSPHPTTSPSARPAGTAAEASNLSSPKNTSLPFAAVPINAPNGFLYEWWTIFWDIYSARSGKGTTNAAAYISHAQILRQEQQRNLANAIQQQQHAQQQAVVAQQQAQQQQQQQQQQHAVDPQQYLAAAAAAGHPAAAMRAASLANGLVPMDMGQDYSSAANAAAASQMEAAKRQALMRQALINNQRKGVVPIPPYVCNV